MAGEVVRRVISAVCMIIIIVAVFMAGGFWTQLMMTILLGLMLYEWVAMNVKASTSSPMSITPRILLLLGGVVYISTPMLYWIYTAGCDGPNFIHDVVWCIAVVSACDVAAYFGGRLLGGPKLAPRISKNKTWSGAVSGFVFGCVASYVLASYLVCLDANVALLSVIMTLASILGDLLESKAKRVLNVKDSGNIIPGHGGVCDRLDSFLLTSYVVMLLRFLGL